jgi:hypothetical protein
MKSEWITEVRSVLRKHKEKLELPLVIYIQACSKRPIDPDNNASAKFIIDAIRGHYQINDTYKEIKAVILSSRKETEDYIKVRIYGKNEYPDLFGSEKSKSPGVSEDAQKAVRYLPKGLLS